MTDAGMPHIAKLKNLEYLSIGNTYVTDDGVAHLSSLKNLRMLYLNENSLTDACLEHIAGLSNLEALWLKGTHVTPAAAQSLQQTIPSLKKLEVNPLIVSDDHIEAVRRIAQCGGKVVRRNDRVLVSIRDRWTGGDEGFKHLSDLDSIDEIVPA